MTGIRAVAWIWRLYSGGYGRNSGEHRITLEPRAGAVAARDYLPW
jgi:hypothetical protein